MKSLLRAALLVCATSISIVAQSPAPAAPQAPLAGAAVSAPQLSELLELKRQNVILRSNLLNTQIESARVQAERENAAINVALTALRDEVEKAHPGWTIGADGAVAPKPKDEPKATPKD